MKGGFTQDQIAVVGETMWQFSSALAQTCTVLFQGRTEWLNALGLHARRKDGSGTSRRVRGRGVGAG